MQAAGYVERITRDTIEGWAYFPDDLAAHPEMVLQVGGEVIARAAADRHRDDLQALGHGRSDMAFEIKVPPGTRLDLDTLALVEERGGTALPIAPDAPRAEGFVESRHGHIYFGWAWVVGRPRERCAIDVLMGGQTVMTTIADAFREDLASAGFGDGHCGFSVDLGRFTRSLQGSETPSFVFAESGIALTNLIREVSIAKPVRMPMPGN